MVTKKGRLKDHYNTSRLIFCPRTSLKMFLYFLGIYSYSPFFIEIQAFNSMTGFKMTKEHLFFIFTWCKFDNFISQKPMTPLKSNAGFPPEMPL